jgi:hypothetical protein
MYKKRGSCGVDWSNGLLSNIGKQKDKERKTRQAVKKHSLHKFRKVATLVLPVLLNSSILSSH